MGGDDLLGLYYFDGSTITRICSITDRCFVNIEDPIYNRDAVNKRYVDTKTTHPYLYAPSMRGYNSLGGGNAEIECNFDSLSGFTTSDNVHLKVDFPGVYTARATFRTDSTTSYAYVYVKLNGATASVFVVPTAKGASITGVWTGFCKAGDIIHIHTISTSLALNNANVTNFTFYRVSA